MKDIKDVDIKVNDNVVFSVGTKLMTGTVVKVREGRARETVRVRLHTPEQIFGYGYYQKDANGEYIRDANGYQVWTRDVVRLREFRDVASTAYRLMVCNPPIDNPGK